ncbi:MAG: tetratricopeptide repeat protein, partial [Flavobacterium sp.]
MHLFLNHPKKRSKNLLTAFLLIANVFFGSLVNSYAQEKHLSRHEIRTLSKKAVNDMHNELFEKSLIHCRTVLPHAILLGDPGIIAQIYNIIGGNLDGLLEYEKALFYYNKALFFAEKTNKTVLKNFIHNNLGNIYFFDKKNFKKGIYHYQKSVEYSIQTKDTSKMVFTKVNMAWAYFDIQKYDEGFRYLTFVNSHFKKFGDPSLNTVKHMLNGMYFSNKNNPKKASEHFVKAIQYGNKQQEKSDLSYAYLEYSKFLNQIGTYKEAYNNLQKFNQLNEEINAEEKIKKANLAGINLELDEYKREISAISSTFKTKETYWLEQQSRNKKIVIIVVIVSMIILLFFYFFSVTEKLKQKNKVRELQNKIQQNLINATIDGQEFERKNIAAFLHDNISA